MTLRNFRLALTAVALLALVPTAMADTKIAAVSIERIQSDWGAFRTYVNNNKVEFDKRSQALEEQKSQLESEEQKYRQADKSQMGPEQRTKLEKSFGDRELDLSSAEKRFDEDYKQRASQISRLFQDSTLNAIKQVAIEKGYDVVMPDLPYVNPSLDITEEVLRKLGQVQLPPVGTSSGKPSK